MRPPFSYYGGKTMLAKWIAPLLPKHEHYVEPFAGSLAVLLRKEPSRLETVNDLDGDLVAFWRVLRERPDELAAQVALTPHSRAEFRDAHRGLGDCDELERARRVWLLLAQSRGGTLRQSGWRFFAKPSGTSSSMPRYMQGYADRIPAAAERLARVSLECRDALDVIRDYGAHPGVCIYADPPYLGSLRASGYRHEMKTDASHRDLAAALRECSASVVLSGYDSPLYAELYPGWHQTSIETTTGRGGARQERTEVLWSNVPLEAA